MSVDAVASNLKWPTHELESVQACPACEHSGHSPEQIALEDLTFKAAPGLWDLQRCSACRSVYLDPRPTLDSIHRAYTTYYTHDDTSGSEALNIKEWVQRAIGNAYRNHIYGTSLKPSFPFGHILALAFRETCARIKAQGRGLERLTTKRGSVLDIGCGNGAFLSLAAHMGWSAYGVELDDVAATIASKLGATMLARHLSDLGSRYDNFFDAVTLSHVIEHLHDPLRTFRECLRVMKPGAYIWVETPNIMSAGYEIYGPYWRGLEPPRHLIIFNPESLCKTMQRAGFHDIQVIPTLDVSKVLFTTSTLLKLGLPPESGTAALSPTQKRTLDRQIESAKSAARRDTSKSEFVSVIAYRPSFGAGAQHE